MNKPWKQHSSTWEVPFNERPEQTCNLDMTKGVNPDSTIKENLVTIVNNVKELPVELGYSVLGVSVFAGFILYLFSLAVI